MAHRAAKRQRRWCFTATHCCSDKMMRLQTAMMSGSLRSFADMAERFTSVQTLVNNWKSMHTCGPMYTGIRHYGQQYRIFIRVSVRPFPAIRLSSVFLHRVVQPAKQQVYFAAAAHRRGVIICITGLSYHQQSFEVMWSTYTGHHKVVSISQLTEHVMSFY